MAETIDDCFSNDNTLAVFSYLDADLRLLAPRNPAVSTNPDVVFIPPPISPVTHPPNQVSDDEPVSPDSTSTIEASDNYLAVEASSTAGVQLFADGTNEYQHELSPAHSFPSDCSPLPSRPNQFKPRAETVNSVHSHQHHNDSLPSKPTANIRPRINSLLCYGLKPEFNSWEIILWDNHRKELTIQNTALSTQCITVPQEAVAALPHLGFQLFYRVHPSFSLEPQNQFLFPFSGVRY